jgi:phosphonate degradation associated HDIG domain protein
MSSVVEEILAVYRTRGDRQYGEAVTERAHALQCAEFARQFGEPDAIVLAALLHDYGHLLHDLGEDVAATGHDALHEELGADRLAAWFPPEIVEPVRLHVAAKRYLCGKEPAYLAGLSSASRLSLELQGGPMNAAELAEFEQHPHYHAAVQVRRYDDMGKVPNMPTADFESYRPLLAAFLLPT